jgi:hypothetical protein
MASLLNAPISAPAPVKDMIDQWIESQRQGSPDLTGLDRIQAGPRANHMAEADAAMSLTPQEKFLYNTHLQNLNGPGKVVHPEGAISSLYQMSFQNDDGKIYNIPTVWNGKILEPPDAIDAARKTGLDKFPSYDNQDDAESRYNAMHGFLEKDTGDFIAGAKGQ